MYGSNHSIFCFLHFRIWRAKAEDSFAHNFRYFRGFIQLQDMVDRAILEIQSDGDTEIPKITSQQMPFPCHRRDE